MATSSRSLLIVAALLLLGGCNAQAREAVKSRLHDPSSAQFDMVRSCPTDQSITYGQVNAKNPLGAYTGFQPFYTDGSAVSFARSADFMALADKCFGEHNPTNSPDRTAMDAAWGRVVASDGKTDIAL